ncbi:MAG TPA: efflux RND transporter periplasmic adaptor subunit [Candidatus Binataceae bacterium]|jgi:multidrug efflux system membrane fusion protein|nr:efflux RND transporter periplasmic adaptor subunit [Candidatus Binataceae bacterium]
MAQKRPAVPVLVAKAERVTVPQQLHAIGTVQAYSTVGVKAQTGGEIIGVHFHEGQEVSKGQLLFTIDPRPFEAALAQARANLARTQAQAELAEADAKRWQVMYKVHAASSQQYDQANSAVGALRANIVADKAAVQTAELNLQYTKIYSPLDGRAGNLNLNAGNIAKANADTAMVVINQIKPIYVQFALPERNLPEIRRHLEINRSLAVAANPPNEPDQTSVGTLTFIDNTVDPTTGTIEFKGTFPNQEEWLWPGQFVDVTLTLEQRPNTVVVPAQAVQSGQNGSYVFVVKPDLTVQMRPIKTGATLEGKTVIDSGLQGGETVVTDGQMLLVPGAQVRIKQGLEAE